MTQSSPRPRWPTTRRTESTGTQAATAIRAIRARTTSLRQRAPLCGVEPQQLLLQLPVRRWRPHRGRERGLGPTSRRLRPSTAAPPAARANPRPARSPALSHRQARMPSQRRPSNSTHKVGRAGTAREAQSLGKAHSSSPSSLLPPIALARPACSAGHQRLAHPRLTLCLPLRQSLQTGNFGRAEAAAFSYASTTQVILAPGSTSLSASHKAKLKSARLRLGH